VLRTVLKPRWLGLLAFLLVVLVSFTWLGLWQLHVARDKGEVEAAEAATRLPVAPVSKVIEPHQQFPENGSGRPVSATGTYDAAHQLLVADRRLDGVSGYWVITPLVVEATGARLVVVRGFVTDPAQATPPTTKGTVEVTGTLAPGESPSTSGTLPPGQVGTIDLGVLLNQWKGSLYNAFVFKTGEQPDATTAGIKPIPPPEIQTGGLSWRNAAYALQWWIFAGFAAYMWWRMVRDDWQQDRRAGISPARERTTKEAHV
jgi:cytochrome oxidase assembly protein ShyY1